MNGTETLRTLAIALLLLAAGCVADCTDGFVDGFRDTIQETT